MARNHPELPTNKQGSLRRLSSLTRKLQRSNLTGEYDGIIREQLQNNVVEVAPVEVVGKEFYIPHKAVIRETAETTSESKMLGLKWDKDQDIRRRAKYLRTCKDKMWSRWQREYLTALRERHNLTHTVSKFQPKKGDVVIVKTDSKNRGTWPLAIVNEVYPGNDGVIRAVQLKTAKSMLERPVQHLYPLELECDVSTQVADPRLNPQAQDFRPRRDAAAAARLQMKQVADVEQCELEERGTFSKKYHQELNKVKIEGREVKHIKLRKHPDNSLCQCKASKDVSELEYT